MELEVLLGLFHFSVHFVRKNVRKRRKKLPAKPVFSTFCGLFIVSGFMSGITRFEFTREKFSCRSDSFFLSVSIPVQSCLNIRMAHNALKGFDIKVGCSNRCKCMSENMCRRAMQIDGSVDAFPRALVGLFCDGTVTADDVLTFLFICSEGLVQFRKQRNKNGILPCFSVAR